MPPIGSLLLALALIVVVGLFVVRPFLAARPSLAQAAQSKREHLEAEKEQILAQIRALDFDFETAKLPEPEYRQTRERLLVEAAALLQQIDSLTPAGDVQPVEEAALDEIEAAVAARRRQRAAADIEAAVAQRRAQPQGVASRQRVVVADGNGHGGEAGGRAFCPQCGQPHDEGDRFCAFCGQKLD